VTVTQTLKTRYRVALTVTLTDSYCSSLLCCYVVVEKLGFGVLRLGFGA